MARRVSELSVRNYKRIFWINMLISIPLLVFFAWPYYRLGMLLAASPLVLMAGGFLFSLAFTFTVMHGYVTMSLGVPHRSHYYRWLSVHNLTYGLFFHQLFNSTRFRLMLIIASLILLTLPPVFQ